MRRATPGVRIGRQPSGRALPQKVRGGEAASLNGPREANHPPLSVATRPELSVN